MKDNKRAIRRAQQQRINERAKRKTKEWWDQWNTYTNDDLHEATCRLANNMKNCSCWMCGNPRKFYQGRAELTQQELRNEYNLKEGIDEYFEEKRKG